MTDSEVNPWLLAACLLTAWVLVVVRVAVASHDELALFRREAHAQIDGELLEPQPEWSTALALAVPR
jgi:hypothetical protein